MLRIFERDDFHLSDEELRDRRYRRRRRLIIVGLVMALLLIGYLSARPTINMVRAWQARRHAHNAFAMIEQGKWEEARTQAVAAYRLRSNEPESIRAVARLLSRAGQADAIGFWKELKAKTQLTPTDLRDEATIAVKSKELGVAEEAINQLLKQPGSKPSDVLLAAELAIQKQDFDNAESQIRKVLQNSSATDRDRLQATLLLGNVLKAKGGKGESEVLDQLVRLARGQSDVSLEALVALSQACLNSKEPWPNPSGMSVEELITALEQHPLGKPPHKLLAVDLKIHLNPDQREKFIRQVIDELKTGDNATLVALAGWLNTRGEYKLELDTIPRQRAMQVRDLFLQHVDALAALGQWDDIRRLIESEQFPLDPVVEHMFLARCFAQQGQTAGAENNWGRALQAAAGDPNKLLPLADYAEKNNALDVASAAYNAAVAASPKLRVAQQGRLRIAYASRDTTKIREVLGELLKIWPNDLAIQNDEAYARLLLLPAVSPDKPDEATAHELTEIERLAEKLVEREPASLPHRSLLALARLKQGRPYDALAVYRDISVPRNALTTSTLAVHAAVLAATNEKESAKQEAGTLPKDKLLPEEKTLIEQALEETETSGDQ